MQDKKERIEKRKAPSLLRKDIADILVASHAHEPYIIAFRYSGDNVAARGLGTLIGFFEIEIHDEDSAYIVNFLASVAKKEYFANIRRGPIESFEAALHKINVALSELVKHGNVSWLGRLNGALAILSGNTIHFSVTGDGAVYLFREQVFRSISEGLTERGNEPHPLKTFVEIASGDLFVNDRVFLFSPSVWTLFTPGDIEKSAQRFQGEALEQFLRTALVNELDSAGAILVSCEEEPLPKEVPVVASPASGEQYQNVFSQEIFHEKERAPVAVSELLPSEEEGDFVDTKTGHIYIQGEASSTPGENPWKVRGVILSQQMSLAWHRFTQRASRSGRRWKKELVLGGAFFGERVGSNLRSLGRRLRSVVRRSKLALAEAHSRRLAKKAAEEAALVRSQVSAPKTPATQERTLEMPLSQEIPLNGNTAEAEHTPESDDKIGLWLSRKRKGSSMENIPPATPPSESLKKFGGAALIISRSLLTRSSRALSQFVHTLIIKIKPFFEKGRGLWDTASPKSRYTLIGGIILACLVLGGWYLLSFEGTPDENTPAPVAVTSEPTPAPFPPQDEKNQFSLATPEILSTLPSDEKILGTAFLRGTAFVFTQKTILNLTTGERIATPKALRQGTVMDDLSAFFLLAEDGTLLMYTPSNKKFAENTLPLPGGARIDALSAYLTYVYTLDQASSKIYRFPRAEGGFGPPVSWLKENISFEASPFLAVNDVAVVGGGEKVMSLSRGRVSIAQFESPKHALSVQGLVVLPETNEVYVLDTDNRRVLKWNRDGVLLNQYFSEDLKDGQALAVSEDQKTLLIGGAQQILKFSLP